MAQLQTSFWQNGRPQSYLRRVYLFSAFVLLLASWTTLRSFSLPWFLPRFDFILFAALVMGVVSILAVLTHSRILSALHLGVIGIGVGLIFLIYGAPDLAITQIFVETLTLIFFLLVARILPDATESDSSRKRFGDALLCLLMGGLLSFIALNAGASRTTASISQFFAERSFTEGFGRNVVNVILVDFRSLDTLGEIVVLLVAALGMGLLWTLPQKRKENSPS